ncbi:acetyl/propionyl/methylcrotonyl-CoA carboxylase subunit alpha [Pseudotabrizicola sp. 4114]|uniref:acetyl/propionyl/methylcrotonyl-CoA carboxylase subunit alpha n=1 Tax=Pseudotabrizicola sp. 4114 TaxID=2817731 RepID=UPI0028577097|nr:3-methylcrotonyl-CoA carboxylase alpha subunit [Pseudorhodobacter sp. 4114]
MFQKILIANRGEIACRVIATCRKLGVATVAVYSDADAGARHVALADEAVHIGGSAVAQSYLRGDRLIEAALATGAEAIHPGYGFLSENPEFVEAVEAAGLVFIGPPANAIRAMGLKDAAKAHMITAGVPVVPGYHGGNQDAGFLSERAAEIGYPVLIKARAGGGGKGMRLVESAGDFAAALESARREADASFGDPACLVEKYILKPRHIEVQVFADSHGNVIHLFERDCSLQRRHQKVIEEAPAPDMPPAVRAAMGRAAVEAARSIGYEGAGTIEFIADGASGLREDGFWFMEMNTRLQVEHPVSEAITGLDFVDLQLRVAAGEPLPVTQQDLAIDGWAMEARLYAEDVPKGFLPATGRLRHLRFPVATAFETSAVRIDSGVGEGDEITPFYDPMIAKVIVHAPTREEALNRLSVALAECQIAGSVTNVEFLARLAANPEFRAGRVDTGLIARHLDTLAAAPAAGDLVIALAMLAGHGMLDGPASADPWDTLKGWRQWTPARLRLELESAETRIDRQVEMAGPGRFVVQGDSGTLDLTITVLGGGTHAVTWNGRRMTFGIARGPGAVTVFLQGQTSDFGLPDDLAGFEEGGAGGNAVIAPMPGLVTQVYAASGDLVRKGDPLLVLEAMKMEYVLRAPRDGVVQEVFVPAGTQIQDGTILIQLTPEE